jgi:recombination DNA repair RAD52 pathway protein
MSVTPEQLAVLMGNLHPGRVSNRKQGGATLSYLEAWDVKATLIRIFGFLGFSADVIHSEVLEINRNPEAKDSKGQTYTQIEALAKCTVRLTIHSQPLKQEDGEYLYTDDVTYTETAAASQKGRDVGEVVDFALKTAESDALKRAAIYLGTQFGLSLYRNGATKDVIGRVFAPGQEWPTAEAKALTDEQAKMLADSLGAEEVTPEQIAEEVYEKDLGGQPA